MKLQQLRFLVAVANSELNISAAAEALYTSQPGVSKQIKMLEDELGVQIFQRSGKNLTQITPAGKEIIPLAEQILNNVKNIKSLASEYKNKSEGTLSIATMHTQAKYILPEIIRKFKLRYPKVAIVVHQGRPSQIADLLASGEVDIAITTESLELFENAILMPCYKWNRCALVPKGHPLAQQKRISIQELASYELVTYVFAKEAESTILNAFNQAGLVPKISFSATEADIIKTYVRLGFGVGIIAEMAYSQEEDHDLIAIPLNNIFEFSWTYLSIPHQTIMRTLTYDFIELFAPHLTQSIITKLEACNSQAEIDAIFQKIKIL